MGELVWTLDWEVVKRMEKERKERAATLRLCLMENIIVL
jgi:hypothetical protein